MRVAVRRFLVILLLLVVSGGHWFALQSVAWAAMLVANLRTTPVAQAVTNTFDGQHPCPLCKAIAAGKKSETKSELTIPSMKLEFLLSPREFAPFVDCRFEVIPPENQITEAMDQQPPTPPPRAIPA
jgi:hypothetical protein